MAECKAHAKELGRHLGGSAPWGFTVGADKQLVPIPEQQGAISLVLRLAGDGYSLRKIQAAVLETLGLRMSHTCVGRILRDARIRQPAT